MEVLSSRTLLYPRDFDRSVRFYDEVLGLRRYREYGAGGRVTGVVWFTGGGHLEVSSHADRAGDAAGPVRLWLQVPDVDREHRRLRDAGAVVLAEPEDMPWGLREMWLADPDGLRICLVQVPDDHPLRRRVG